MSNHYYLFNVLRGYRYSVLKTRLKPSGQEGYNEVNLPSSINVTMLKQGTKNKQWSQALAKGDFVGSAYDRWFLAQHVARPLIADQVSYSPWGSGTVDTRYDIHLVSRNHHLPNTTSVDTSICLAKAQNAWYASLRNQLVGFQGGVFTAEFREARQMIKHRASQLLNLTAETAYTTAKRHARDLRQLRFVTDKRYRAHLRRRISSTYLEGVFGWMPLVSDIQDAFTTIQSLDKHFVRISASGKSRTSVQRTVSSTSEATVQVDTTMDRYSTSSCRLIGFFDSAVYASLPERFGFTSEEFPLTLWEATPWSFLVDYFVPIGEFLASACYSRFQPSQSVRSFLTKASVMAVSKPGRLEPGETSITATPGLYSADYVRVRREIGTSIGYPLTFYVNGLNPGPMRSANILALIGQSRRLF